jgi:hypothetical protein
MSDGTPTVVGTAVHNGWAVFVTVCVSNRAPFVVDRRREELVEPGVPSQPYHHEALELELADAAALIERVRKSVVTTARAALSALRQDLEPTYSIVGTALPEQRAIPSNLAEIIVGHKALYIADRELYVASLGEAARSLGLQVWSYPRKGEFEFAADATGTDVETLRTFVSQQRKVLGAPWQKDHQTAAAGAIGVLATIGLLESRSAWSHAVEDPA